MQKNQLDNCIKNDTMSDRDRKIKYAIKESLHAIQSETEIPDSELNMSVFNTVEAYMDTDTYGVWCQMPDSSKVQMIDEIING